MCVGNNTKTDLVTLILLDARDLSRIENLFSKRKINEFMGHVTR